MKQLFDRHYQKMVYFGCKFIPDIQEVQDIVAEVFLYYNKQGYDNEAMLYFLVKARCLNHIRDQRGHQVVEISASLLNMPIENEIMEVDLLGKLYQAIDRLPAETKQVLTMFYFENKQCRQIAAELGKTDATVRSIKRYAINSLYKLLANETENNC
jgi:RNA polymerase sigma-70 factor (ECF subfamily)